MQYNFWIDGLTGGGTQAVPYRGEQAVSDTYEQFFERPMIAVSGLFHELSFSSFVWHDRIHFIHISLEPPKALAEIRKNRVNS